MADPTGGLTLLQSYQPYGEVLNSEGNGVSNYGFANEWTDATGLQHLRARYLDTVVGRFISRDVWGGDYNRPLSLNKWMHVQGNPVNFTDPSGMIVPFCPLGYRKIYIEGRFSGCEKISDEDNWFFDNPIVAAVANPSAGGADVVLPQWVIISIILSLCAPFGVEVVETITDVVTQPDTGVTTWEDMYNLPEVSPEPKPKPKPTPIGIDFLPRKTEEPKRTLFHYTDFEGMAGIVGKQRMLPSLADDERAAFGHGQYFTDISPSEAANGSPYQLSRALFKFQFLHNRTRYYVAVNVYGLPVENVSPVYSRTYGNKYIYLHRSEVPLPVQGRIEASDAVPYTK
jgi:RHS repeat-associated protein